MRELIITEKARYIPLFAFVSAGFPSPALDFEHEGISLDEYCIKNKSSTYISVVEGDSMTGAGILDGDLVLSDWSLTPKIGDIVVAAYENEFVIKRMIKNGPLFFLASENHKYPPLPIEEHTDVRVHGVVIGVIRKMK